MKPAGRIKASDTAAFELYFRRNPFRGGYAVAAGLETAVAAILESRFSAADLDYLRSLRTAAGGALFPVEFLAYLEGFRFSGTSALPTSS